MTIALAADEPNRDYRLIDGAARIKANKKAKPKADPVFKTFTLDDLITNAEATAATIKEYVEDQTTYDPVQFHPGSPWTIQSAWCTPKMAAELLKRRNLKVQRSTGKTAGRISADIERGLWHITGDMIKLDWNNELIDGQTRLEGIVKSGVAVRIFILRGLDPDAFHVEGEQRRKGSDVQMKSYGLKHTKECAALIDFLMMFNPADGSIGPRPTKAQRHVSRSAYGDIETAALRGAIFRRRCHTKVAPAAAFWYFATVDADLATKMFATLQSSDFRPGSPIRALNNYINNQGARRKTGRLHIGESSDQHTVRILTAFTVAWNALRKGKVVDKLVLPDRFPQIDGLKF